MPVLLAILLQAAPAPMPPERFSILAPVPAAACESKLPSDDVVVCAAGDSQRLPLPDRGPPSGPSASNRNLDGKGALTAMGDPCATVQGGCQVGVDIFGAGTAAIRLVQKLVAPDSCCEAPGEASSAPALIGDAVGGIGRLFAQKPDKSNRIPIPLD